MWPHRATRLQFVRGPVRVSSGARPFNGIVRQPSSMSYDFRLLPKSLGANLLALAHFDVDEDESNLGERTAEAEERKARLSRALISANPSLSPFAFGFAEIAKTLGISEDEARVQYRHIELNGPENGNGIQITLFDEEASVTVPFWHQGNQAAAVIDEIWGYLNILEGVGDFAAFDPQLDKVLDLATDKQAVYPRIRASLLKCLS
jgi:hypothetical protein